MILVGALLGVATAALLAGKHAWLKGIYGCMIGCIRSPQNPRENMTTLTGVSTALS